jgi:hypothetical protein
MIFTIVISQNERLNASIETLYLWKDISRCIDWVSEWYVAYRHLNNFSAISGRKQVSFQWDDDEIRFVPDQHAYLDVHSASSLEKNKSADEHVAPLGHISLIPSQPVFALSP